MIFKKHNKFKPYLSIEKADDHTVNPKRGWYSIYPFTLPERPDFEELQWCLKKQESLCLVRVCIGNYAARSFDTPALTVFEEILSFFARHDKDMILRIIYEEKAWNTNLLDFHKSSPIWTSLAVSFTNMLHISTLHRDFLSEAGEKCILPNSATDKASVV